MLLLSIKAGCCQELVLVDKPTNQFVVVSLKHDEQERRHFFSWALSRLKAQCRATSSCVYVVRIEPPTLAVPLLSRLGVYYRHVKGTCTWIVAHVSDMCTHKHSPQCTHTHTNTHTHTQTQTAHIRIGCTHDDTTFTSKSTHTRVSVYLHTHVTHTPSHWHAYRYSH